MIAVTGATGHLGQLVIEDLIQRGTAPNQIAALVRSKSKAQNLVSKGVDVRESNYDAPETLEKALRGVEKLLLISGMDLGQRARQHGNVITAAKKSGVKLIAYTSIVNADKSKMFLAGEHYATEKALIASGVPYVLLRNAWYTENYTEHFATVLQYGVLSGSAKDGRVSVATRADFAAAAAAVLLGEGKVNSTYELAGKSFTLKELAAEIAKDSGKNIVYKDMPEADFANLLKSAGLPAPVAEMLADSDSGIARGDLFTESRDLENLLHRPPTSWQESVKQALK